MTRLTPAAFLWLISLAPILAVPLAADTVVLSNGDTLNGQVLSLDANQLKLKSDVLGEVAIDRKKVLTIHFGDLPVKTIAAPQPAASQTAPAPANPQLPAHHSVDQVLQQLQAGGVDANTLGDLQKQMPLLANPEVQQYFNKNVMGLMTGDITIDNVRKDAANAREQILDLKKDLGPQADALNGYLSILEGFLKNSGGIPVTDDGTNEADNER